MNSTIPPEAASHDLIDVSNCKLGKTTLSPMIKWDPLGHLKDRASKRSGAPSVNIGTSAEPEIDMKGNVTLEATTDLSFRVHPWIEVSVGTSEEEGVRVVGAQVSVNQDLKKIAKLELASASVNVAGNPMGDDGKLVGELSIAVLRRSYECDFKIRLETSQRDVQELLPRLR